MWKNRWQIRWRNVRKWLKPAKNAGVPLFVAYHRRALPGFNKLREIIESGEIGKVRFVNIEMYRTPRPYDYNTEGNWRIQPGISGGGYFHDMASHQLDYLDWFSDRWWKRRNCRQSGRTLSCRWYGVSILIVWKRRGGHGYLVFYHR